MRSRRHRFQSFVIAPGSPKKCCRLAGRATTFPFLYVKYSLPGTLDTRSIVRHSSTRNRSDTTANSRIKSPAFVLFQSALHACFTLLYSVRMIESAIISLGVESLKQLGSGYAECFGDDHNVPKCDVAFAALDAPTYVRSRPQCAAKASCEKPLALRRSRTR
jgi:hypothetical protein